MHNDDLVEIDLVNIIKAVIRRIWAVVLAAIIGGSVSFFGLYFLVEDTYEAKALFYVSNNDEDRSSFSGTDIVAAKELAKTYIVILKSKTNLEKVAELSDIEKSYSDISDMISASQVDSTEIFEVTVTGKNKNEAEKVAAAVVDLLPESIAEVVPDGDVHIVDGKISEANIKDKPYKKYVFVGAAAFASVACIILAVVEVKKSNSELKKESRIEKISAVCEEDLFKRQTISVDNGEISEFIRGKTVLVTGGGGSVGSELCRQISDHAPEKLIIFDIYENNAYLLCQELLNKHSDLNVELVVGSVRDKERVRDIFSRFRPDIVFHAAAHKHVPLMETSPCESVKNNVFGTWNVAEAADEYKAETFVLISTDKAVNPTSIMGASKRICEMIVKDFAERSDTKFACVRFGNVMGSNGSVIPLFKQQIEQGGPVTVTHKDVARYFMTIPEAVSLVMQAGAYAKDGEIFVLDMGEPVKIEELARKLIKLSGLEPDKDIAVEYTGLRPGEKLFEELLLTEEGLEKTANDLIFIGHLEEIDREDFERKLEYLKKVCESNSEDVRKTVMDIVPAYHPQ